jgi:diaminopimelate decarboxylase
VAVDSAALLADAGLAPGAGGGLALGGVDLGALAARVGTPAFVYHAEVMRQRYRDLDAAFRGVPHRIHYAVKANGNLSVLRLMRELGAGADIVSAGELARCLAAGFDRSDIVFSGVGKTPDELREAAAAGLASIHVESLDELDRLGAIADSLGRAVDVGIRWNPDVEAGSHPYISTGQHGIKFGIPMTEAPEALALLARRPALRLVTLAVHVGSQLTDLGPLRLGVARLGEMLDTVRRAGVTSVSALDLGGGLGIRYADERPPSPEDLAAAVLPLLAPAGVAVHLEPGRFLTGSAGVLLTRVLYRKEVAGKTFVVVDAGMTDLLRPSHYDAYHHIVAVGRVEGAPATVDVVGPVCETGDFLALDRPLPPVGPGDLLAVLGAGAYAFVMASTYNARPRPPEVLVDRGAWRVVRERESVADLMRGET